MSTIGLPIPGGSEIVAVSKGISSLIEYAKIKEDAKTQRALMMAKKEIDIATIDAKTELDLAHLQREMSNDREFHAQRMEIIKSISALITENATQLTPEMMIGAQFLLQVYRAIGE